MFEFLVLASPVVGFMLWYALFTLELGLNGFFTTQRTIWDGLEEEFSWIAPGASKRRGDYIRKMIDGWNEGYIGDWKYSEIREKNLYEQVGWAVLPGYKHFLFMHVAIPLLPLIVSLTIYRLVNQ